MSDSVDKLSRDAVLLEYTKAANPLAMGTISKVPYKTFPRALYEHSQTAMIPLDVSDVLQVDGPATSPALCANYVKILAGASLSLNINATSVLFYVMWGAGTTHIEGSEIPWQTGDFVALPVNPHIHFQAQQESVLYLVHDEPLLRYLGARAEIPQFEPTLYTSETTLRELKKVQQEGEGTNRNRISILLMNRVMDQTLTVTHTLWAMLGVLPKGAVQLPHRHQSVALDLILDCPPGCYTLVGPSINSKGEIQQPERVDWQPYSAFITPPGYWHAHFNESNQDAHFIPMQDAGLQTYLRTLDIKFVSPNFETPSP
ncbi:MAG: cupin [Candidatus Methylopumilus sp.]|jgi:gentisate 1,2-dioxygenase|nr:cupin [Candidatus Methylopumilus sp.]NBW61316.1 cupin [Methylophilaceae bacterium]